MFIVLMLVCTATALLMYERWNNTSRHETTLIATFVNSLDELFDWLGGSIVSVLAAIAVFYTLFLILPIGFLATLFR